MADIDHGDEFSLEPSPDGDVWVKHRATGHVFKFTITADNTIDSAIYLFTANPESAIDVASLVSEAPTGCN